MLCYAMLCYAMLGNLPAEAVRMLLDVPEVLA
jgi:hypothetical protein